jgi:hypothetical protein
MKDTIGSDGCACGDYESENLIASASCRKSGESPDWNGYVAHRLKYRLKNEAGTKEIGRIIHHMLFYGADGVVVEHDEELTVNYE